MPVKYKLYIDANIFLGFYNSNQPEFKKLLAAVCELSDEIIITQQIVDEVCRNKVEVFRTSILNYVLQANFKRIYLPEHLVHPDKPIFSQWNQKRSQLEKDANEIEKELMKNLAETMRDVSMSTDKVSVELKKLFSKTIPLTEQQMANARLRREKGNPPGKPGDPLGDQLSWTQLLDNITDLSALYIITNDGDYMTDFDKQLFLNAYLQNELKAVNPQLEVKLFNKLSVGLAEFNKHKQIATLPDSEELKAINKEEAAFNTAVALKHRGKFYGGGDAIPISCPGCNSQNSLQFNHVTTVDASGRQANVYVCIYCNAKYTAGGFEWTPPTK